MATKKKPKIDPRVAKLIDARDRAAEAEKEAKGLKAELFSEYGLGTHDGFVFLYKSKRLLDADALEKKLGDLDPYKKDSPALHIEFPKS